MAGAATKCINALREKRQDISMLFLLKRWDWLVSFSAGRELATWVRDEMRLRCSDVCSREFQRKVEEEFKASGSGIHQIAPERFVFAVTKDDAKRLCWEAGWPRPFFPVMLQTRPGNGGTFVKRGHWKQKQEGPAYKPGVFVICSCWSDAIHVLVYMAGRKEFHGYPAEVVYENQIVDLGPKNLTYPCRVILDCDAKLSEFNNEFTLDELRESIDRVPLWYVQELLRLGAVKPTDRIWVTQKNKDRETKASSHFIFSIYGISIADTRELFERIFVKAREEAGEKERKVVEEKLESKRPRLQVSSKKRKTLPEPWMVTDPAPFHGRAQFSTLLFYAKNKGETQMPIVTRQMAFLNGMLEQEIPIELGMQLEGPSNPRALELLHMCCYSSFVPDFVTFSSDFMIEKGGKGGNMVRSEIHSSFAPLHEIRTHKHPMFGDREKKLARRPVLSLAPLLGTPAVRRVQLSCRRGWNQQCLTEDMRSTKACPVSVLCMLLWWNWSLKQRRKTLPTSLVPSFALTR
jgi:hypothetical protein